MIDEVIKKLILKTKEFEKPLVTKISLQGNPFAVLVSTLLSLRTKDKVTEQAYLKLSKFANTPQEVLNLTQEKIEKEIYPVGFYRTKALRLQEISQILIDKYGSKVPDTLEQLLELPGVGRKTANLVLTLGFGKLGICVDTHVHRISNRLGIVKTKTADETEFALRKVLPKKYWIVYNDLLVAYGQNLCMPVSPFCSRCVISHICPKIGVKTSR